MALRQIGQEQLALGGAEPRGGTALDEVAALIDWAERDRLVRAGPLGVWHLGFGQRGTGLATAGPVPSAPACDLARPL